MPVNVDKRTVELAKILFSQGKNKSQIAREMGISCRTVGRYLQYDDDPEFADELAEIRRANQMKFITDSWQIIHAAAEVEKKKISACSAKEASVIKAINADKVHMMETTGARQVSEDMTVTFNFKVANANTSRPLPVPDELPQLPGEVPGDDRGQGERQDIQLVPRSDENVAGESGDTGSGSSIDLPVD